jgi:hypothetical protein
MSPTKSIAWAALASIVTLIDAHDVKADDRRNNVVALEQTSTTPVGLLAALRDGHVRAFGKPASDNRLAMAWGQVAFENGQGKLSYNHNLGNVIAGRGQLGYYNKSDHHVYRSFDNFVDGATAYWEVIKHCNAALVRFDQGDALSAAAALKRCRYFEADLSEYTKGFVTLYRYAQTTVIKEEKRERQEREDEYADAFAATEFIIDCASYH